jgi:enoyl-[acyl-carrier protein] reductase I
LGILDSKRVLVCGARNKWSIAWHCAQSIMREGGCVAFSVLSERESDDIRKLLEKESLPNAPIYLCDATQDDQVERLFAQAGDYFGGALDGLVHGIAFANRDDLAGEYVATSKDGFALALDRSVYSLVALTRGARPLMQAAGGGSVVTLTYLGGERVVARYNVMGVAKSALDSSVRYLASDLGSENIRVNAISAGPIKTLAAGGIAGFTHMLGQFAERNPMRRAIDADEVGDAAAFLLSPLARAVTGEVLHVDLGYHMMGM